MLCTCVFFHFNLYILQPFSSFQLAATTTTTPITTAALSSFQCPYPFCSVFLRIRFCRRSCLFCKEWRTSHTCNVSLRVLWSCSELGLTNNTPFLNGCYFTIIVDICFACFRENSIVWWSSMLMRPTQFSSLTPQTRSKPSIELQRCITFECYARW